jgi:isopentenyldiphosphate isomerase
MRSVPGSEQAHRAASDAEAVIWVDAQDQPLGSLPRAELRQRGLIGRGCFIFLFNSAGELCVHQRTLSKALYPGYWDVAAGGMVGVGESYAQSAARELQEELGIGGVALTEHGRFLFDQSDNRLWATVYSAQSDAPLRLQREEVQQAHFLPLPALADWLALRRVCPDSLRALRCLPRLAAVLG